MVFGLGRVFTPRFRFVRYGRIATKHARSLHYRFWHLAADLDFVPNARCQGKFRHYATSRARISALG